MLDMLKSLLNEIKNNSLFAMFSHKNITIAGIIVIAVYMIRIRYYPINLSIENGVALLLVSYISGIFYVMLWCAIISLGWTLSYITKEAYNLSQIPMLKPADKLFWIEKINRDRKISRATLATIFLLILFHSTGFKNTALLAIASTCIYAIIRIIICIQNERKTNIKLRTTNEGMSGFVQHVLLLILLLSPISMPDIYGLHNIGEFIDKTMEIANIRIKNKDIYIKAPYGELFAANSGNTTPVGNNFIILRNATILLNDIGGETLISYGDTKTAKRLSIPSAYVSIGEISDLNKEPSLPREPSAVGSQK